MKTTLAGLMALAAVLPAAACGDNGVEPPADAELSILFIGNSLTMSNELPDMVAALIDSVGAGPTHVRDESIPGTALVDHWDWGYAHAALAEQDWDYVVMQQGPSATEGRPYLYEYADKWGAVIREAGAVPVLYMVWPAESRSFDFDGVSESYTNAAFLAEGVLVPAGDVWRAAWALDGDLDFYSSDRFHPSVLGSYAAALTMAAVLSGRDPSEFPSSFETQRGWTVEIGEDSAEYVRAAVRGVLGG